MARDIKHAESDMKQVSRNFGPAFDSAFRTTEKRTKPKFHAAAKRAAGADRRLSGMRRSLGRTPPILTVKFDIRSGDRRSILYIRPEGPWGIRDNTDTRGGTRPHLIEARRYKYLKFTARDGSTVRIRSVNHPGSSREPFWKKAQDEAIRVAPRRLNEEVATAVQAALNGRPYRSR